MNIDAELDGICAANSYINSRLDEIIALVEKEPLPSLKQRLLIEYDYLSLGKAAINSCELNLMERRALAAISGDGATAEALRQLFAKDLASGQKLIEEKLGERREMRIAEWNDAAGLVQNGR